MAGVDNAHGIRESQVDRSAALGCEEKTAATSVEKQSVEEHNPQLYLALTLLCKGSALVTLKNTEVNNGLEAWRGLIATYDSNSKG